MIAGWTGRRLSRRCAPLREESFCCRRGRPVLTSSGIMRSGGVVFVRWPGLIRRVLPVLRGLGFWLFAEADIPCGHVGITAGSGGLRLEVMRSAWRRNEGCDPEGTAAFFCA